jgi:hypothetical protein
MRLKTATIEAIVGTTFKDAQTVKVEAKINAAGSLALHPACADVKGWTVTGVGSKLQIITLPSEAKAREALEELDQFFSAVGLHDAFAFADRKQVDQRLTKDLKHALTGWRSAKKRGDTPGARYFLQLSELIHNTNKFGHPGQ